MSLNTFTNTQDGLNAHLNIGADTMAPTNLSYGYDVREVFVVLMAGPTPFTLLPYQMISGLVVLQTGTTGALICPSSADIDAELGASRNYDGFTIWLDVINRNSVLTNSRLIPPDTQPGQDIPIAQSPSASCFTRFYFTRENSVWVCVNS